jgi:hypothetical protein
MKSIQQPLEKPSPLESQVNQLGDNVTTINEIVLQQELKIAEQEQEIIMLTQNFIDLKTTLVKRVNVITQQALPDQTKFLMRQLHSINEYLQVLHGKLETLGVNLPGQIDSLGTQLGTQISNAETNITSAVNVVGDDVKEVKTNVKDVQTSVNTGFLNLTNQINDFREEALLKLSKITNDSISNCQPLKIFSSQSFTEFLYNFFKCLYYFGLLIINIFNGIKNVYMFFRSAVLKLLKSTIGIVPIINNMLDSLFIFMELNVFIVLVNTIGVFFGCEQIVAEVFDKCYYYFFYILTKIYQLVLWSLIKSPVTTNIIMPLLNQIKFFERYEFFMSHMTTLYNSLVVVAGFSSRVSSYNPFNGGGKRNSKSRNKYGGADDVLLSLSPNKVNINQLMNYMYSILNKSKPIDAEMIAYFDTPETRELAIQMQKNISSFSNLLLNFNSTTQLPSTSNATIEELNGGKRKRRKRQSKRRKSKRRKSKRRKSKRSKRRKSKRRKL